MNLYPHVRVVICEGAHDLWVMQRVLEHLHSCKHLKVALTNLPRPFGSFIQRQVGQHYLTVQTSSMNPETPHFSLAMTHSKPDLTFAFFTANGGVGTKKCIEWLSNLRLVLGAEVGTPGGAGVQVRSTSVCVVVDADDDPDKAREEVRKWWGAEVPTCDYVAGARPPNRIGLWIWPDGHGAQYGTLETVLDDVDGGPEATPGVEIVKLLKTHAPKDCKYAKQGRSIPVSARQTKARLGVQAQWHTPGGSWATWLKEKGLSDAYIDTSAVLKRLGCWLVQEPSLSEDH